MTSVGTSVSPPSVPSTAVRYAGFGVRLAAYLIDLVILVVVNAIAILGVVLLMPVIIPQEFARETGLTVSRYVSALIGLIYFLYFWGRKGATPGKKMLKLRIKLVTGELSGEQGIGQGKAFLRLIGYAINSFLLFLPFLMILFNQQRRGLHDFLAGTVVVRER